MEDLVQVVEVLVEKICDLKLEKDISFEKIKSNIEKDFFINFKIFILLFFSKFKWIDDKNVIIMLMDEVLKKENSKLELFDKKEEIENKFIEEYKFLDIVVSLFKFFSKLLLVEQF